MTRPGIFLTFSAPASPDDDEAYNFWYDQYHGRESLLLPGFIVGRRYKLADEQFAPQFASESGLLYATIYEVDDIDRFPEMQRVLRRMPTVSQHRVSGMIAPGSVKAFMYEQIAPLTPPARIVGDAGANAPRRGIFLTFSSPASPEGDMADNERSDSLHASDALLPPGAASTRRFKMAQEQLVPEFAIGTGFSYVTVQELDDVGRVPALRTNVVALPMLTTDTDNELVPPGSIKAFAYTQVSVLTEPAPIPEGVDLYGPDE